MMSINSMINLDEARFFYTSPNTMIDNSGLESFGLIRSAVDVLVYYGINEFTADDIRELFDSLQLIRKKNGRVFVPSVKKISGVLECYLGKGTFMLERSGERFRAVSWDCGGYRYEIEAAKQKGYL